MSITCQRTDQRKKIISFSHKLKRIRKEELFKARKREQFDSLTPRELQVLTMVARDNNNPEIADELCISRSTVEQHRKNINRKLNIHSLGQLFQYSLAFNLV